MAKAVRQRFRKLRTPKRVLTAPTTFEDEVLSLRKILDYLKEYGVVLIALVYILGFVITNIYLGSLGVVSLELVRTRYLLVGSLFLAFIASVVVPFSGYVYWSRQLNDLSGIRRFLSVLGYLFVSTFALLMIVLVFDLLSGLYQGNTVRLPQAPLVLAAGLLVVIGAALVGGISSFETSSFIERWVKNRSRLVIAALDATLTSCLALLLLFISMAIVVPVVLVLDAADVSELPMGGWLPDISIGWLKFLVGSVVLQIGLLVWYFRVLQVRTMNRKRAGIGGGTSPKKSDKAPGSGLLTRLTLRSYALVFLVGIFLPLYALVIYPSMPQQFGGGSGIPVVIVPVVSNEADDGLAACLSQYQTILLDRTSSTHILLLEEYDEKSRSVLTQATEITTTTNPNASTVLNVGAPCFISDRSQNGRDDSDSEVQENALRLTDTQIVLEVPNDRVGPVRPKNERQLECGACGSKD